MTLATHSTGRVSWFGGRGERLLSPGRYSSLVANVVGLTIAVVGAGIAASGVVDAIDGGPDVFVLLVTGVVVWAVGSVMWRVTIVPKQIRILDVFTTVTLAWVAMAIAGAIPYLLTGHFDRIDDALFESISGFTTTGATVTPDIEATSKGLLFWRSTTQWMGGMGVIVLVVAVLPTVGSGGMSLLAAEAPGPTGERLTPRVRETARRLWAVYVGFTIVLAGALRTGRHERLRRRVPQLHDGVDRWVLAVPGLDRSVRLRHDRVDLHRRDAARRRQFHALLPSAQARPEAAVAVVGVQGVPAGRGRHHAVGVRRAPATTVARRPGFRDALFTTVSTVTTTGYVTTEYGLWSQTTQLLLLLAMPIGAMAGSTAGGVKVVRVMAIASFAHREALRHLHPHLVRPVRVGNGILPDDVARRVVGFMILALAIFGGGAVLISATGPDMITSLSSSATAFGNVGPGLGSLDHANDFLSIPAPGRAVAMAQMLLGRLEIYPVILALSVVTLRLPKELRRRRRSS